MELVSLFPLPFNDCTTLNRVAPHFRQLEILWPEFLDSISLENEDVCTLAINCTRSQRN